MQPETTPHWATIPVIGYTDVNVLHAKGLPVGWITRKPNVKPFSAFYCDGHSKEAGTFGTLEQAQLWISAKVGANILGSQQ